MTLPLTPERMRLAYEYLSACPPFIEWNLPDGNEVIFKIIRSKRDEGYHLYDGKIHTISVSEKFIGRTQSLMELMAHEMIHVHQRRHRLSTKRNWHDEAFQGFADQVCEIHGFDRLRF